ncbi:MAG TPA: hypothetical protein PLG59_10120 [bacterium]|nr:hypothetical protein [bacterium]HQO35009.1 hypothetical protein [bacterium]HQP96972.1 hypothetical protein [bacterium]
MDPIRSAKDGFIDIPALLWLRWTLVVTLFIAAFGALVSFRDLAIYWGVRTDAFNLAQGTAEYEQYQILKKDPASHLSLAVFNLLLWTIAFVSGAYLLRLREWARILLKIMITVDLFVTLGVAIRPAILEWILQKPVDNSINVDLVITTFEVFIVLVLSHPRVMFLTALARGRGGETEDLEGVREHWPDKSS